MYAAARLISDYDEFISAVRQRCDEINLSRNEIDKQAGIADGLTGKILGPKQVKGFGRTTLGLVLGALGCKLLLVEDAEQTARIRARAQPRQTSQVRHYLPPGEPERKPTVPPKNPSAQKRRGKSKYE